MEDSDGRYIDFKNTVILLTSNAGHRPDHGALQGPGAAAGPRGARPRGARAAAEGVPAGAARAASWSCPTTRCPTRSWATSSGCSSTASRGASASTTRCRSRYDDAVVKLVVSRCTEVESGGRMIDAILTNTILPRISEEYLTRMVERAPAGRHHPVGPERRLRVRSRLSTTMARMMELTTPLGKDLLFREPARTRGARAVRRRSRSRPCRPGPTSSRAICSARASP